jgi:protein O-mannosyl-transferase
METREGVVDSSSPGSSPSASLSVSSAAQSDSSSNDLIAETTENPPGTEKSLAEWLRNPAILFTTIAFLTFILYVGTLSFPFVWDDGPLIVHNPLIRSWSNLPSAFGGDLWHHMPNSPDYYRPLLVTWFMLNYSLFKVKAWAWHLGAVLIHIVAAGGVFALARKLGLDVWTTALAALLFAFHPVHVECVAWVCSSDSLLTVFLAFSFVAFLKSRDFEEPRWLTWRTSSLLLFFCGLLTKEVAVTFAAVVAVYVFLFPAVDGSSLRARIRQSVQVALPFGIVSVAYLLMRRLVLGHVAGPSVAGAALLPMIQTWPLMLCNYLRLLIAPVGLSPVYYLPYVRNIGLKNFVLPLFIAGDVCLLIWFWARRTKDSVVTFASLWVVITLAPVLYTIKFRESDLIHDRYLYLPSVGFVILLAKAIRLLPGIRRTSARALQIAAVTVLTLGYGAATYAHEIDWASDLLIFYRAHSLYPQSGFVTVELARELSKMGRYQRAIEMLNETIEQPAEANSTYPRYYLYYLLGDTYLRNGNKDKADEMLGRSDADSPRTAEAQFNRTSVAMVFTELGEYRKALAICSDVLRSGQILNTTLMDCGNINLSAGQYPDAEKLLTEASAKIPNEAAPAFFLGRLYFQTGRMAEAETSFRKAVGLDPTIYDYRCWYGRILALRGDIAGARREFSAALALNGDGVEAKAGLAALASLPRAVDPSRH